MHFVSHIITYLLDISGLKTQIQQTPSTKYRLCVRVNNVTKRRKSKSTVVIQM